MSQFFIQTVVIMLAGVTTVALIAQYIFKRREQRTRKSPPELNKHELERREYDTMLQHRRRARLQEELNEQNTRPLS